MYANQQTAMVNQAYKTIKDPLTCAGSFLGLKVADENKVPDELFMRVMEVREAIEDATSLDVLDSLGSDVLLSCKDAWESLRQHCQQKNWEAACEHLTCARYWAKVQQEISVKRTLLGDS